MYNITDPEVRLLATYSGSLRDQYGKTNEIWEGSPFAWIKTRPSRQVGTIGEKLVSGYLAARGFDVTRSPDREADRLIKRTRAEIKLSTLWENGLYKFQQLRNQNYRFVICLGISPFDAHCWILPKNVIMKQWSIGGTQSHHRGKAGRDTAWLQVDPNNVQNWLREWGGSLSEATSIVTRITKYPPLS